ncbi:hypothetical protein AAF712_011238 [Marasmius tenuissimus]|uniref:Ubiquitin-like protease family profile domain-containing protein n=1 Tax=Marasmius tenuissimus TaxID=585030 RepID=A0ABR2ZL76_9AGAR|nr:hypothetical protein PM082_001346 [Marasmius tenuissimus]
MQRRAKISLGRLEISPRKKRSKANATLVNLDFHAKRKEMLRKKIAALTNVAPNSPPPSTTPSTPESSRNHRDDVSASPCSIDLDSEPDSSILAGSPAAPTTPSKRNNLHSLEASLDASPAQLMLFSGYDTPSFAASTPKTPKARRKKTEPKPRAPKKVRTAAEEAEGVIKRWKALLPTLEAAYLQYKECTIGKSLGDTRSPAHQCSGQCIVVDTEVHVYHVDHHRIRTFRSCSCQTLAQSLVLHGFFPTSPSQYRTAIAIDLLDLYQALCEHSSDAVTSLAAALETTYRRRGFRLLDSEGKAPTDPLRRALGHSLEWYDMLRNDIDRHLNDRLEDTKTKLPQLPDAISSITSSHTTSTAFSMVPAPKLTTIPHANTQPEASNQPATVIEEGEGEKPLAAGQCAGYLQRLCPACFGGQRFGESFQNGGDIHVALDGNFHHRHLKSGGDGVEFYDSYRFLDKEFVDAVGVRIEEARKKPPKPRNPVIPDEVIDADSESYKAAKGDKEQASSKRFDENGMMALVCRHDIPLLAASIDTPGEQQKFAIALLEDFFQQIPDHATVAVLYDVGCVLDRSLSMYDLLDESIVSRIQFATAVLHAYGHQWTCQIYYNPRMKKGLGLTDGEGNERLWSNLRKLIGLERRSSRKRRIWLLDRQCDAIAEDHREGLGTTIQRKLVKFVQKKEAEAVRQLRESKVPVQELRSLWEEQRSVQRSPKTHAPARLKKELEQVLKLQSEIRSLQASIDASRSAIKKMPFPPSDALFLLAELERTHSALTKKAEELYDSLNLPQNHPNLTNVPLEYLHTLLLARDTKIAIRAKAIASFQEFAQIDQAVGGAHEAIGTKAHQKTRQAISKRRPALENLIRRYNEYCAYLETSYDPSYNIPVPKPLPLKLSTLRDTESSGLWEDVWITASTSPPRWLTDDNVRTGIRAVLILDRCAEERRRLTKEAKNLCLWFRNELHALMVLINEPSFVGYRALLKLRLQDHLLLADQWSTFFIAKTTFEEQIKLVNQHVRLPICDEVPSVPAPFQPPLPLDNEDGDTEVGVGVDGTRDDSDSDSVVDMDDSETDGEDRGRADGRGEARDREVEKEQGEPVSSAAVDSDYDSDDEDIVVTGEVLALADLHDSEDSEDEGDQLHLEWRLPKELQIDAVIAQGIKNWTFPKLEGPWSCDRMVRLSRNPQVRHKFQARELAILENSTARLNEDCVNGCAILLQEQFSSMDTSVTVFSTFTIPSLMQKSSWTQAAWRVVQHTEYWSKRIWIIPIHSRTMEHWAVAIVKADTREIILFDSFASKKFLAEWLPKIQVTVSRLTEMARSQGQKIVYESLECLSDWVARPLRLSAVQHNGYDCGLWILWVMVGIFRGYDYAHLEERDVSKFRWFLKRLIRTLPRG